AAWDGLLGTAPDTEVARTIGCSVRPVEKRRARLRVRPFQGHARIDWARWDGALGMSRDRETAEIIGCSQAAVESRRRRLGISAPDRATTCDEGVILSLPYMLPIPA
ncbi:MAG: hypothetical protein LBF92_01300, partial [Synergistaceae bacterium]|nr:hypothetical protein [Synergistaceae bacterium]